MFDTGRLPLAANRWTPFAYSVAFIGYDFTGATFKAQVRDRQDGGFVRADMTVTPASVTTDEGVPTRTVGLEIPEATMEAMAAATEAGDDAIIEWHLHIPQPGGVQFVALEETVQGACGDREGR